MEAYNEQSSKIYNTYTKTKSWLVTFLGVIITLLGIAVVFIVASLEGTKEIRASNYESGRILNIWRTENNITDPSIFPQEKTDIIEFRGKSFYFIIPDDGGDWYFAYDGGVEYVFADPKFYILTSLTIVIATFVSFINYISTIKAMCETEAFIKTLRFYQKKKEAIEKYTQYIPAFCSYKNQQVYEEMKKNIIEEAGIRYEEYIKKSFKKSALEDWQKKKLKAIEKISVKKLKSSDLLQEHGQSSTKTSLLPISQREHQKNFLISGSIQKTITSALGGLVVTFGVVLGNWVLGITYGFVIVFSYISSVIIATDFVSTTLRNRFLAKADLLNEFDNIKEIFMKKEVLKK